MTRWEVLAWSALVTLPYESYQIILRARQNFLVDKFRTETIAASPGLVMNLRDAWRTYVHDKLGKGKGLPDGDKPAPGDEEKSWSRLVELFQNKDWKQECSKRDEKFEMYFSAAVGQTARGQEQFIECSHPESDVSRHRCC
jgi:hypothetical protein